MTSAAMPRRQAAWRSSAVRAARAGPPVHSCGDRWAREGMPSASKRPWSSAGPRARTSWPRSTRRRARAMSGFTLPPPAHVTSRNRAVGVVTNWLSLSGGQAEPLPSGSCSTTCVRPTGTPTGRPPSPRADPVLVPAPTGRIVPVTRSLDDLLAEAQSAAIRGWDFSWLDGRASEERPSWGYSRLLGRRLAQAAAALDVETGGGALLAGLDRLPPLMEAADGCLPNL